MNSSSGKGYKETVAEIRNLHWDTLRSDDLKQLMHLSYTAALEFAEALRIAERLYPESANVRALVAGELETNNLKFGTYKKQGDHAVFLKDFLISGGVRPAIDVWNAGSAYKKFCRTLPDDVRAMSVFSREDELSGIFARILSAPDWSGTTLAAYRYFLETHIQLDSGQGGHHDLTSEFPIDERVGEFYEARLNMYRAIPKLFN